MKIRDKAFSPEEKVVQRTSGLRSSRYNRRQLFLFSFGLFGLLAGFARGVLHAEADAGFKQGGVAAGPRAGSVSCLSFSCLLVRVPHRPGTGYCIFFMCRRSNASSPFLAV